MRKLCGEGLDSTRRGQGEDEEDRSDIEESVNEKVKNYYISKMAPPLAQLGQTFYVQFFMILKVKNRLSISLKNL